MNQFISGPKEIVKLQDDYDRIILQPNKESISQETTIHEWKIIPQNMMEVRHNLVCNRLYELLSS